MAISNGSLALALARRRGEAGRPGAERPDGLEPRRRSAERDLLPFAERTGPVMIGHSPLAQGTASGKYHSENPSTSARASPPLFLPHDL